MKFNLSAVPAGSTVSKATLRLYVDAVITGGQFDVYNLPKSPAWTERTLTFSSPPPPLGSSATGGHPINVTATSLNNFLLIDLTSTVQGWLADPTGNNGLALGDVGGTGWFSFDSKESFLIAHQPELEIVTAGQGGGQRPQGPQGPQGVAGPAGPVGPAGPQGTKGDTGLTGATGMVGPVGPQGATGNPGPAGPMGFPGPAGSAGPAGTNGTGFTFRNAFDNSASYAVNDVATFTGATYLATVASVGPNSPTPDINTAAWTVMAAQGAAGAAGNAGPVGPVGSLGPPGAPGPVGPPGPAGPTSINSLSGLPCSLGGFSGTTALTFAFNGVATLTCVVPNRPKTLGGVINITPSNPSIYLGNSQQFTATGLYSDGSSQDITGAVTWSSPVLPVATMGTTTGVAYVVAPGSTTIVARLSTAQESGTGTTQLVSPTLVSDGINNSFAGAVSLGTLNCGTSSVRNGTTFPLELRIGSYSLGWLTHART